MSVTKKKASKSSSKPMGRPKGGLDSRLNSPKAIRRQSNKHLAGLRVLAIAF